MESCVFCKIASGEFPTMKVYEDETTLAFMDNAKDVDGHILVIPKKHVQNILDCDNKTLCDVMQTVKRVSNHLTDNCGYEGVDFLCANDESADNLYCISMFILFLDAVTMVLVKMVHGHVFLAQSMKYPRFLIKSKCKL